MACLFCNNKEVELRMIYKDNTVMAFPTNIPITVGHVLVCPVRHISKIDDLLDNEVQAIKNLIIQIKNSLKKSFDAEGFNIAWNEGSVAGQSVDHLHIHIVPRKVGDTGVYKYEPREFLYRPGSRNESSGEELQEVAEFIKGTLT